MNCKKIKKKFSKYLDGEIKEKEKYIISSHLKTCKDCAEEYENIKCIDKKINMIANIEISTDFEDRLKQKIEQISHEKKVFMPVFIKRLIAVPAVLSILILFFSIFTISTPFIYGIGDAHVKKYKNEIIKSFFVCSSKNIFEYKNFVKLCNMCIENLCKCKDGKTLCPEMKTGGKNERNK